MKPDSQCARVLRVLSDGEIHSVPEIHRHAGMCRLNSRVAELRTRGYDIECVRIPGRGAASYAYRLVVDRNYIREGIERDLERYGHVAAWREPIYHAVHAEESTS